MGDDAADDWVFRARDAQLPPPNLGWGWLFLGGRGTGKSHSMSAAVHMAVRAGISRIHLIAPTAHDFHDVNLEDRREERESNLMRVKEVSASRGEAMHAEPISLLYGKGRMLRRRGLDQLEAEMMAFSREWDRAVG
jgi:phage terminase large subunit-like protein